MAEFNDSLTADTLSASMNSPAINFWVTCRARYPTYSLEKSMLLRYLVEKNSVTHQCYSIAITVSSCLQAKGTEAAPTCTPPQSFCAGGGWEVYARRKCRIQLALLARDLSIYSRISRLRFPAAAFSSRQARCASAFTSALLRRSARPIRIVNWLLIEWINSLDDIFFFTGFELIFACRPFSRAQIRV